jgi:hypothetical protein
VKKDELVDCAERGIELPDGVEDFNDMKVDDLNSDQSVSRPGFWNEGF